MKMLLIKKRLLTYVRPEIEIEPVHYIFLKLGSYIELTYAVKMFEADFEISP